MGLVAYKLSLPSHSKLHLVFHVSCLKKVIGTKFQTQTSLLELDEEGSTLVAAPSNLGPPQASPSSMHNQGIFSSMEGYITRGCHMGASYHLQQFPCLKS
jgi:hypothetical protein